MWLAHLALLRPSFGDFGNFNFLLGTAIIGSTANKFEIRGPTWFALVDGLRLAMESLTFTNQGGSNAILSSDDPNVNIVQSEVENHSSSDEPNVDIVQTEVENNPSFDSIPPLRERKTFSINHGQSSGNVDQPLPISLATPEDHEKIQ